MRHLVIGQRKKAPNFSAFHWSLHGCLITIGQRIVTTRVVHLPKRTKTSLIIESDQSRSNHKLLQLCTVPTAWSDVDQAVRAVHSYKSWCSISMLFFCKTARLRYIIPKVGLNFSSTVVWHCKDYIAKLNPVRGPFQAKCYHCLNLNIQENFNSSNRLGTMKTSSSHR